MKTMRGTLSSPRLAQFALGFVYFHFGFLKWFPDLSPAELLSTQTVLRMQIGLDPGEVLMVLAIWECSIGLLLLFDLWRRPAAILLLVSPA